MNNTNEDIQIYGKLVSASTEGVVTDAASVWSDKYNKNVEDSIEEVKDIVDDREYNPQEFSGNGYKILRKNVQEVTCAITKIQVTKTPTTDGYISIIINGVETHVNLVASTDNTVALVAEKIANKLSETMNEYVTSIDGALVTCTRRFGGDVTSSSFSGVNTGSEATVSESSKTELRNLITAVMLNQSNCIYEIRYDFDLDGKTLEVPENCTLKFEGGSIGNGALVGNTLNHEFKLSDFRCDLVNLDNLIRNFCTEKLIINFDKDIEVNDIIYIHRGNIELYGNNHSITGNYKLYIDNNGDDLQNVIIEGIVFNIIKNYGHTVYIGKCVDKDERLNIIYNFKIKNCEFNTSFRSSTVPINFEEEVNRIALMICGVLKKVHIRNNKFINEDTPRGVAIMLGMPYTNYVP